MPVHVDQLVSDVSVDAPAATPSAAPAPGWQEQARIREAYAQVARDAWRTAAEGFDD